MIFCMLERVSGGDAKFQGFCDGWNKWEGQVFPSPGRTDWTARCHRTALSNSNGRFYIQGTKQRSSVQVSVQAGEVEISVDGLDHA